MDVTHLFVVRPTVQWTPLNCYWLTTTDKHTSHMNRVESKDEMHRSTNRGRLHGRAQCNATCQCMHRLLLRPRGEPGNTFCAFRILLSIMRALICAVWWLLFVETVETSLRFFAIGDTGTDNDWQRDIAKYAECSPPWVQGLVEFIFLLC